MNWKERVERAKMNGGKFTEEDKELSIYICSSYLGEVMSIPHVPLYVPSQSQQNEIDFPLFMRKGEDWYYHDLYLEDEEVRKKLYERGIDTERGFYQLFEIHSVLGMGVEVNDIAGVESLMKKMNEFLISNGTGDVVNFTEEWREVFGGEKYDEEWRGEEC